MKTQALLCFFVLIGFAQVLSKPRAVPEDVDSVSGRIISGWPAAPNQFPYQVYFQTSGSSGFLYTCGGSLVGTQWVLTAAHCLWEKTFAIVRFGSVDVTTPDLILTSIIFYIHPDYVPDVISSDIGLINLGKTVSISESIRPIRLPTDMSQTYSGEVVTASGWGRTSNTGTTPETLNYVNLTVIENSLCQTYYDPTDIISDFIMCAVGSTDPSQNICGGDSGGPLVIYESDGQPTLVGVVSFGKNANCDAGNPSGFTRTTYFLDWINNIINVAT